MTIVKLLFVIFSIMIIIRILKKRTMLESETYYLPLFLFVGTKKR